MRGSFYLCLRKLIGKITISTFQLEINSFLLIAFFSKISTQLRLSVIAYKYKKKNIVVKLINSSLHSSDSETHYCKTNRFFILLII